MNFFHATHITPSANGEPFTYLLLYYYHFFRFYFLLLVYYLLSHELSLRGAQVDSALWWLVSVIISYIYFCPRSAIKIIFLRWFTTWWTSLSVVDDQVLFFILFAKNKLHNFTLFLKWFILPIIACSCTNKIIIFFSFL